MAARTIGRTLLVAATLALAAGASPALSGVGMPLAGIAWTPDAIVTAAAAGGPSILCWLTAAWRPVAPGIGSSEQAADRIAMSAEKAASTTEVPPPPPVQMAPLSYGGGRGDDPAGPWPNR